MQKPFKCGDKVAVIDDMTEGYVISVNGNEITLEDEHGFHRKYAASKLVRIADELLKDDSPVIKPSGEPKQERKRGKEWIVDLHSQDDRGFPSVLEEQIRVFYEHLNLALQQNAKKIIFIHGVGKGVLRKRLESELKRCEIPYTDAPYHTFGTGALELNISRAKKKYYRYAGSP